MSLKAAFEQAAAPKARKTRIGEIMGQLDSADTEALNAALTSSTLSSAELAGVLTRQGFPVGETTIRRERDRRNMEVTGL